MGSQLMQRLNAFADASSFFPAWLQNNHVILSMLAGLTLHFYIPPSPRGKKERPVLFKVGYVCVHLLFYILHHITAYYSGFELFLKSLDNNILFRILLWSMTLIFMMEVKDMLPDSVSYDPLKYIDLKNDFLSESIKTTSHNTSP